MSWGKSGVCSVCGTIARDSEVHTRIVIRSASTDTLRCRVLSTRSSVEGLVGANCVNLSTNGVIALGRQVLEGAVRTCNERETLHSHAIGQWTGGSDLEAADGSLQIVVGCPPSTTIVQDGHCAGSVYDLHVGYLQLESITAVEECSYLGDGANDVDACQGKGTGLDEKQTLGVVAAAIKNGTTFHVCGTCGLKLQNRTSRSGAFRDVEEAHADGRAIRGNEAATRAANGLGC
eukprot:4545095-Prymnesium_polylepis.1